MLGACSAATLEHLVDTAREGGVVGAEIFFAIFFA